MFDKKKLNGISIVFLFLFLVGSGIRAVNICQPVDTNSWREADVAGIARNYYREGMNLFKPRIDWRGDGQGYTEAEFPMYPWTIAIFYKLFGYHEWFGRALSYLFSLFTLFIFIKLARHLLTQNGAIAATMFFTISPLTATVATSIQPDGLMFMFYLLSVYAFVRWIDDGSDKYYVLALFATMFALLAKLPAAHIGLVFAALLLMKKGRFVFKDWRVYLFGIATLLPSVLWYWHAKRLWLTYGNSLGISNEEHWTGIASLIQHRELIKGITTIELTFVLPPIGLILIVLAFLYQTKNRTLHICLVWLATIVIYYLMAANTTSSDWATYYHVVSVPPVALLLGLGVSVINFGQFGAKTLQRLLIVLGALGSVFVLLGASVVSRSEQSSRGFMQIAALIFTVGFLLALFNYLREDKLSDFAQFAASSLQKFVACLGVVCFALVLVLETKRLKEVTTWQRSELRDCATAFSREIPQGVLIIASGGDCVGDYGQPVAYNSSYMFYWLDRKGFNICREQQSIEKVNEMVRRGAKYFVAEKSSLMRKPNFESELKKSFILKSECDHALLFGLEK